MDIQKEMVGAGRNGVHPDTQFVPALDNKFAAAPQADHTVLDIALFWANLGFRVFPCLEGTKTPAIPAWNQRASYDPAKVRAMWSTYDPVDEIARVRSFNVGIACGRMRDAFLLVVDGDVKGGGLGLETLSNLDMIAPEEWLNTKTIRTWSGGVHYYFKTDIPLANTASKLGPNVDTRGEGGYVVAPGSIVDGKPYVDLGGEMRSAPQWLVEAVGAAPDRNGEGATVLCLLDTPAAIARATAYLESASPAIEGLGGNSHTLKTAMRVKDFGLSQQGALELMFEKWNPTCAPPWEWEELAVVVGNAYRYGRNGIGILSPENDFEALDPDDHLLQVPGKKRQIAGFDFPISGEELMSMRFDEPKWAIQNLIPEGLTILAGRPKIGKSWLTLAVAEAVCKGSTIFDAYECATGSVLLLALEDPPRRLQSRLLQMGASTNAKVTIKCAWRRLDQGGLDDIRRWLDEHPDARVIVIDTLAKVKPRPKNNASGYDADADALAPLQRLAIERGVAILALHHDRKLRDDDWLAQISGTLGLTGVADTLALLSRKRGSSDGVLNVTGRDVPEIELKLRFDEASCRWAISDDLDEDFGDVSPDQANVLRLLTAAGPEGLTTAAIGSKLQKSASALSNMLKRLRDAGLAHPLSRGRWSAACRT